MEELHRRARDDGKRQTYAESAANSALVLMEVTRVLLDRLKQAQAKAFLAEGGFIERLYRVRTEVRNRGPSRP